MVVGETADMGGETNILAARYLPNGALDTTYGAAGIMVTDIRDLDLLFDVAIQVDGKAVAAGITRDGNSSQMIVVVRYNTNGTLDPAFGNGGIVETDINVGNFDWGQAIALQPDYKIVVAGETFRSAQGTGEVVVTRYTTDFIFVDGFESGDANAWTLSP